MATHRRYELSDTDSRKDVDLTNFADEIMNTIEEAVPGKHPMVYADHFETDNLTHAEAVRIGRALSQRDNLKPFGKTVTIFRLFSGKTIETKEPATQREYKGGRKRK